ncbi:MAG: hypothetical protein KY468_16745 [Armatimonadetes bacterium]|nr:hypothetical protein [Armatimonadota bacterium]
MALSVSSAKTARNGSPVPPPYVAPKVLVLNFDPIIEAEGGRRLHEVAKWNDPRALTQGYIDDVRKASGDYVRYRVVEWRDVDAYPVKKDGFRYTDESYLSAFRKKTEWHQPDAIDYVKLIREFDLERRVESGEIDEVWVHSMPYAGMWESTMAGKGAYWCNSPPVPGIDTSRIFVIMGFNYERGVGEMLENLGHRTESILTHVYGSWEPKPTHAWNRFTLYDKQVKEVPELMGQLAACGNVHYAPNSTKDYQWGNPTPVWSTCSDWRNYPNLSGQREFVDASEWGNGDIRKHHVWWFSHLPRARGRTDGKLNNWWGYVADFNRYPESRE